jgi:hypothetical protein
MALLKEHPDFKEYRSPSFHLCISKTSFLPGKIMMQLMLRRTDGEYNPPEHWASQPVIYSLS